MLKTLKKLCEKKRRVLLYTNQENTSKFDYGQILAVNDKEFAIYSVTPDGKADGIMVKKLTDVIRVGIGGQYEEKIEKLCAMNHIAPFDEKLNADDIVVSALQLAKRNGEIVSLVLLDSDYFDVVGFIDDISDGLCTVREVDEYGFEDGITHIPLENITELSCGSEDENRVLTLWKINYDKT